MQKSVWHILESVSGSFPRFGAVICTVICYLTSKLQTLQNLQLLRYQFKSIVSLSKRDGNAHTQCDVEQNSKAPFFISMGSNVFHSHYAPGNGEAEGRDGR